MEEDGGFPEMIKNYLNLKQIVKQSKIESERLENEYETTLNDTKLKLNTADSQLNKMYQEVV